MADNHGTNAKIPDPSSAFAPPPVPEPYPPRTRIIFPTPTTYWPPKNPSRFGWPRPETSLREATLTDIPRLTSIVVTSLDTNTQLRACFPRSDRFPVDFGRYIYTHLKECALSPVHRVIVVDVLSMVKEPPALLAFAIWERVGPGAGEVADQKDTGYLWLNRRLCNITNILSKPVSYNYAVDYTALQQIQNAQKEYEEIYWGNIPRWHLRAVVTHKGWRGFGIGGQLINWGMQRAHEEGVVAAAETIPEGTHCEEIFRRLKWMRNSSFLPTVGGVDMGTAMMYAPATLIAKLPPSPKQQAPQTQTRKSAVEDMKRKVTDARSAADSHVSRTPKEFGGKEEVSNDHSVRTWKGNGLKENKDKEAVVDKKPLEIPGGWVG
ncbi:hypothetical protein BDD12DRAFT_814530 [Trichophaea hybrida]|nr:hypothetical protein BDD12DRAFT_814530 [Trichophaea hybrida]